MPSLDDCPQTTPPNPSRAAGLPRNWWLLCVGITGWLQLECPAALRRNAHRIRGGVHNGRFRVTGRSRSLTDDLVDLMSSRPLMPENCVTISSAI